VKRTVILGALIGFVIPAFWGIVLLLAFNARPAPWIGVLKVLTYITCPPWMIPAPSLLGRWFVTPFLNAGVYALAAFTLYRPIQMLRRT
jgi:hypothetical protein